MAILILGLVLFLGVHSIKILVPGMRATMIGRMGEGAYKASYSLVSGLGLALIVWGFAEASTDPTFLFVPPNWGRHLAMTLMIPAAILVFFSAFPANGIKRFVSHPLLSATMLWALAHIAANGDLAGVVLFGCFLVWAVIDRIMQPSIGMTVATDSRFGKWDVAAILAGICLYVVLLAGLHFWLFGVSPIV